MFVAYFSVSILCKKKLSNLQFFFLPLGCLVWFGFWYWALNRRSYKWLNMHSVTTPPAQCSLFFLQYDWLTSLKTACANIIFPWSHWCYFFSCLLSQADLKTCVPAAYREQTWAAVAIFNFLQKCSLRTVYISLGVLFLFYFLCTHTGT